MPGAPRRRRHVPRSRQELRERAPTQHPAPSACAPSTVPVGVAPVAPLPFAPVLPVAVAPVAPVPIFPAVSSGCLYSPYECSVYRYPPQWCSSCQVRAASMCAQLGQPDIRMVFRPACTVPATAGACQPACHQPAACPTSVATCCPIPERPLPPAGGSSCPTYRQ